MTKFTRKPASEAETAVEGLMAHEPEGVMAIEPPMPALTRYRLRETKAAVQYMGSPIPGVTCNANRDVHCCDASRAGLPHVHTIAPGGMTVLRNGDWIMPVDGGPFAVIHDAEFRAYYEVPK